MYTLLTAIFHLILDLTLPLSTAFDFVWILAFNLVLTYTGKGTKIYPLLRLMLRGQGLPNKTYILVPLFVAR